MTSPFWAARVGRSAGQAALTIGPLHPGTVSFLPNGPGACLTIVHARLDSSLAEPPRRRAVTMETPVKIG